MVVCILIPFVSECPLIILASMAVKEPRHLLWVSFWGNSYLCHCVATSLVQPFWKDGCYPCPYKVEVCSKFHRTSMWSFIFRIQTGMDCIIKGGFRVESSLFRHWRPYGRNMSRRAANQLQSLLNRFCCLLCISSADFNLLICPEHNLVIKLVLCQLF